MQGHAGTGKTTMLKQVVELAGAERIVALAPSSSAARTLQRETGLGTKTLQWFLTRYRDVGDGCADDETLGRAPMAFIYGSLFLIIQVSLQGVEFRVLFERHRSGRKTACLTPFAVARYA